MVESENNPEPILEEFVAYNDQFVPIEGREYQWLYDHVLKTYEAARTAQLTVWQKADRGVGYASAIVSLLIVASIQLRNDEQILLPILSLGIGASLAAIAGIKSLRIAWPTPRQALPDILQIDGVFNWTESQPGMTDKPGGVKGKIAALIAEAAKARTDDSRLSGTVVRSAYQWLLTSAIWLLISFPLAWLIRFAWCLPEVSRPR